MEQTAPDNTLNAPAAGLEPKALASAAKAAYVAHHPVWPGAGDAWDDMGGSEPSVERAEWEITIQAAVTAYLSADTITIPNDEEISHA